MSLTLNAERGLRARIKTRLECGCIDHHCHVHGPADAADTMLVNYIKGNLMLDIRRQSVQPLPKRLNIPHCGSWEELSKQLAEVWWWCHNNNANLQHGELDSETCTFSICLLGDIPAPNTFHADTPKGVMEKASAHLKRVKEGDFIPPDPLAEISFRKCTEYGEQQEKKYHAVVRWALDVIGHHKMHSEGGADDFATIARHINNLKHKCDQLSDERESILDALPDDSACKHQQTGNCLIDDIRDLVKRHDKMQAELLTQQQRASNYAESAAATDYEIKEAITRFTITVAPNEPPLNAILRQLLFRTEQAVKVQRELDDIFEKLPADSPCKIVGGRLVSEDVRDLVDFMEATKHENEELGRFIQEHGAQEGENLIQLIVRKDRTLWQLIQALSPFYLFGTAFKTRHDVLTDVVVHENQGLCVGAFQTAHETLSEVLKTCPKKATA